MLCDGHHPQHPVNVSATISPLVVAAAAVALSEAIQSSTNATMCLSWLASVHPTLLLLTVVMLVLVTATQFTGVL